MMDNKVVLIYGLKKVIITIVNDQPVGFFILGFLNFLGVLSNAA